MATTPSKPTTPSSPQHRPAQPSTAPPQTPQRPAQPHTPPQQQPGQHPVNQPPAHPPNQPAPGQPGSDRSATGQPLGAPSPLPSYQAGAVTQQPTSSEVSRPPYTHPTTTKDELPPKPLEDYPITDAEYDRPIPKPGDRDWVAGSPATDFEADATEKEAKARLAAGKEIYAEYGQPIDYEGLAGEEGRDEAGRRQSPDRDTQARLRYEDEVRRATEVGAGEADKIEREDERDRRGGPRYPDNREHETLHDREAREAHEARVREERDAREARERNAQKK